MTANEIIDCYVADVAVQLPRKLRNDVAFELRALLQEQMQDRADALGRAADAPMATDMLRAFGNPRDVAARYLPALTIIEPADGHKFLRVTAIGLAAIWVLGLLKHLQQPIQSGWDLLSVMGQWWVGTVIPSLWWPGLLLVMFGIGAWTRRRWLQDAEWKPLATDRLRGGRAALVMGVIGMVCGLYVLTEPSRVLDIFWGGKAAPAAYQALTYTEAFLQRQAPWLFALIALNIPLYISVIIKGRWTGQLQTLEKSLALANCAAMAWAVADGPIFLATSSDQTTKVLMTLIIASTLVYMLVRKLRSVRPAPGQQSYS